MYMKLIHANVHLKLHSVMNQQFYNGNHQFNYTNDTCFIFSGMFASASHRRNFLDTLTMGKLLIAAFTIDS